MDKFGFYSEGPKISVEDHLSKLDEPARSILQEIRGFVLALGPNIVEEARPHRMVYSKSFNFRVFMDIEPAINVLAVSVKTEPRGPPTKMIVSSREQLQELRELVQKAYARI